MNLKIQLIEDGKMPTVGKKGDFCYDCYARYCEHIEGTNLYKYGLGFRYEIPQRIDNAVTIALYQRGIEKIVFPASDWNIAISIRPRSSISKTGMRLTNSIGTADELYRGEVTAVFEHYDMLRPIYNVGDKVCQMHFDVQPVINLIKVDEISTDTERGEGGYGSTGK